MWFYRAGSEKYQRLKCIEISLPVVVAHPNNPHVSRTALRVGVLRETTDSSIMILAKEMELLSLRPKYDVVFAPPFRGSDRK